MLHKNQSRHHDSLQQSHIYFSSCFLVFFYDVRLRGGKSLCKINVTLDVTTVGWGFACALSLPTRKLLTSTAELSSIYLTTTASSYNLQQGRQQIESQTVSKFLLPKDSDTDPNHPVSPKATSFL